MSAFLLSNWDLMNAEIFGSLEESKNAMNDLYSVLLNSYLDVLEDYYFMEEGRTKEGIGKCKTIYSDLLSAANDAEKAKDEFLAAPLPPTEKDAINIAQRYYDNLLDYDEKIAEDYKICLKSFLSKYNIRYRICSPCKLTLTLQGLLWTQLDFVKHFAQLCGPSQMDCIKMVEHHLNKIDYPYEENYCIGDSIKLIEHFLREKTGEKTLGHALDKSGEIFPCNSARESLRQYYEFSSNYPNLRHIGDPERFRDLNKADAMLALSLAVVYSAFIIQDYEAIISGKYIKVCRENENNLFASLFRKDKTDNNYGRDIL